VKFIVLPHAALLRWLLSVVFMNLSSANSRICFLPLYPHAPVCYVDLAEVFVEQLLYYASDRKEISE
jgi:hypothetical protein